MKRIIPVLLSLCLFLACVPTPEEEPIINRTDAYENVGAATADGPQNVTGEANEPSGGLRIDEEYTTPRGVPVKIHADVTAPMPGNIPIVRVETCTFSKEQILAWIDVLAEGASLCEQPKDPFSREYYAGCVKNTQEAIEGETDPNELDYLEDHLRILSGFSGILRPFDGVTPYRLEMQSRLKTDFCKNLYDFWGDAPARALKAE